MAQIMGRTKERIVVEKLVAEKKKKKMGTKHKNTKSKKTLRFYSSLSQTSGAWRFGGSIYNQNPLACKAQLQGLLESEGYSDEHGCVMTLMMFVMIRCFNYRPSIHLTLCC
ncbi:hypothetical protein POM88_035602 [Heracleum sosnowskyi]|uniref:Uncharacterized protein n=1 Tax=Heracleum sosnowskyi TaxID=360622 RepID=A0AAD8MBN7_9APIA|nr:hypothetical protein POM88_035602 [Heracleum sosnowskyi]